MEGPAPVCSICSTQRKRFFWAVWWSGPPTREPFRKPDASNGGARTREEARAAAEAAAGFALGDIDGGWARAWTRVLRGQAPFGQRPPGPRPVKPPREVVLSIWRVLGVDARASLDGIKRAYRAKALEQHPDRGGDPAAFRALTRAYEAAVRRRGG